MAFDLSTFQTALASGGARPSLFELEISGTPAGVSDPSLANVKYFCNVSALPPLTVTPIERQYFGRTVKIPGDIVYGDLTTTIIMTEASTQRSELEKWMNEINGTVDNKMNTLYDTASDIEQFDVTWTYNYYTFA